MRTTHPSRFRLATILSLALLAIGSLTSGLAVSGGARYVYDKAGRLLQVIADDGSSAVYNYDPAGNITSVQRLNSATKALTGFTPSGGAPGTIVTIYGSGFSTTPASNSVSFNGVPASVSTSTANSLVVSAPPGFTTGKISVTVSGTTLLSPANFTALSGMQPPSITSISPVIGAAGTAITVTGSGFPATSSSNAVLVGNSSTTVTSASPSALGVTLGSPATSGRVKVITPFGTAFSSQFFLVPPSSYTAANVEQSGGLTLGAPLTVTMPTASKISLFAFEGVKNQKIGITIVSSTFGSCTSGSARLLAPNGTTLGTLNLCAASRLDAVQLPETATYRVLIVPGSGSTGTLSIDVANVKDKSGAISVDGPSLSVTTDAASQDYRVTFRGTAQQRVRLAITLPNLSPYSYRTIVTSPDGSVLSSVSTKSSYASGLLILPKTGTYSIHVDVPNASVGQATFAAYSVPDDVTAVLPLDGPVTNLTTTAIDQNYAPTFTGAVQQRVRLAITLPNASPVTHSIKVLNPDGSTLSSTNTTSTWASGLLTLPQAGTYRIYVDAPGELYGQGSFELRTVPPDVTGNLVVDAAAISRTTTAIGQNYSLTFDGSAQQRVRLAIELPSVYPSEYSVKVTNPDNSVFFTKGTTGSLASGLLVLPQTGTYKLYVTVPGSFYGQGTFGLFSVPADVSGTLVAGGSSLSLSTVAIDQNFDLSFSGTSLQKVRLTVSLPSVWPNSHSIRVINPDGSTFQTKSTTGTFDSGSWTLPQTGTFKVYVDSYGSTVGTGTFGLSIVP